MSARNTTSNLERMVTRTPLFATYYTEFKHTCKMEYCVERLTCDWCMSRIEQGLNSYAKPKLNGDCVCALLPSKISENCIRCGDIKEEIQFIRSEIIRTCTNYGIEVAQTLETNPLFPETIEKMALSITVLEHILRRQEIHRELDAENDYDEDISLDDSDSDTDDNVSELSFEDEIPENHDANSEYDTEHAEIHPEVVRTIISDEEENEEEEDNEDDEQSQSYVDMFVDDDIDLQSNSDSLTYTANESVSVSSYHTLDNFTMMSCDDLPRELPGQGLTLDDLATPSSREPSVVGMEEPYEEEVAELTTAFAKMDVSDNEGAGQKRKRSDSPEPWLYECNV
jgi:hypothetical protein